MGKEEKGRKGRDKGRRERQRERRRKTGSPFWVSFLANQTRSSFSWFLDPVDGFVF